MQRKLRRASTFVDRYVIHEETELDRVSRSRKESFLAKSGLIHGSRRLLMELKSVESKRNLVMTNLSYFGSLIIIFSVIYVDNEYSVEHHEFTERITLISISLFTVLYAFCKFLNMVIHRKILIISNLLAKNSPLLTWRIIGITLFYLIHPNLFINKINFQSSFTDSSVVIERKLNVIVIAVQLTIISRELLRQLTVSNQLSERDKYEIRTKQNQVSCFDFSLKYLFINKPFSMLLSYLLLIGLYLSLILKLAEFPTEIRNESDLYIWNNSIWASFTVMLSMGYGNCIPVTYVGRFISVISGVIGYILFSLFVIASNNSIRFKNKEHKVFLLINKRVWKRKLRNRAADVISLFFKTCVLYNKEDRKNYLKVKEKFQYELLRFKHCKEKFIEHNSLKNFNPKAKTEG